MKRRNWIQAVTLTTAGALMNSRLLGQSKSGGPAVQPSTDDRAYWVSILTKMATPILDRISKERFRAEMPIVKSETYDYIDPSVGYLEAFGRLLAGMAPWLALPDDKTAEGKLRAQFKQQALLGIQHGVNPASADYFSWRSKSKQPLVDAAHLAQAFMRAPKALWEPLPQTTKQQVITEFKHLRWVKPNESNWLLFAAMTETFLYSIGEDCVREKIDYAVNKFDQEWYVGDGWYSDGARFSFDHYNGYVIHCMQVETLKNNLSADAKYQPMYDRAYKRMQRYAHHLERMISPEGTYPVVGRSATYRNAAFQPLAAVALDGKLPPDLSNGQVRAALTAVLKHIYADRMFHEDGWMALGFLNADQGNIADSYTNSGSLYTASLSFLPLGLPPTHAFWSDAAAQWSSQKAFAGLPFPKDYYVTY